MSVTSDEEVLALWRAHEGNGPGAVLEFARKISNAQRIADAELCKGERVNLKETKHPEDAAYNRGCHDCMTTIRSKIEPENGT